ncbi:MAG: hypothetical protein ACQEUT_06835 [Bacillota bacterium]
MLYDNLKEVIVISDLNEKSNAQKANQQLNDEFYKKESVDMEGSKTEKANKKIKDRLENGEHSKGVDPEHYLANNGNSLVTKGIQKKK